MKFLRHSIAVVARDHLALGSAAIFGAVTQPQAAEPHHTVVPGDAVQWGPAPPSLPPGAQAAVLLGSPAKEGPFVLRLKFPAGFIVPPHRHSKDEFVTVISGKFGIGSGEKLDRASAQAAAAGELRPPAGRNAALCLGRSGDPSCRSTAWGPSTWFTSIPRTIHAKNSKLAWPKMVLRSKLTWVRPAASFNSAAEAGRLALVIFRRAAWLVQMRHFRQHYRGQMQEMPMSKYENILGTIGNTPVVRINRLAPPGVNLFVKIEAFNPLGSVKDRLALGVIEAAEQSGELKPGQTVIEATSGNTGIGLAMVCAQKGYPLVVTMAEHVQRRAAQAHALSRSQGGADPGGGPRGGDGDQGCRACRRPTAGSSPANLRTRPTPTSTRARPRGRSSRISRARSSTIG